jgi:murein DD-endopeptidase MepM/ murein hydrolase activator NlpD
MYIYLARLAFLVVIIFSYHSASAQESLDSLLCWLDNPQILKLINSTDSSLKTQVLTQYEFKLPIYHPLSKLRLNSNFGFRIHPLTRQLQFHQGIDLKASLDQQVFATADGIIIHTGYSLHLAILSRFNI